MGKDMLNQKGNLMAFRLLALILQSYRTRPFGKGVVSISLRLSNLCGDPNSIPKSNSIEARCPQSEPSDLLTDVFVVAQNVTRIGFYNRNARKHAKDQTQAHVSAPGFYTPHISRESWLSAT